MTTQNRWPGVPLALSCTRALAHVGMPGTGVHAIRRQGELQPAGNVDRDQGGDVGNAVRGATDIGIRRQALLELLEEARDTRSPALGQSRDLLDRLGTGMARP